MVSRYPSISKTFIQREVDALRGVGVEVKTFSVRRVGAEEVLSDADREAFRTTTTILPPRPLAFFAAHARALGRSPSRYLKTLAAAVRSSPGGLRRAVWMAFYFLEAIVLWHHCQRAGIRHVHAHFANVGSDVAMLAAAFGDEPDAPWSWSFTMHGPTGFEDVTLGRLREKVERARFVVAISDYARSQLMSLVDPSHWEKIQVVHCGLDPATFRSPRRDRDRGAALEILNVGRLAPVKAQAVLLEAVEELGRRGVRVHATVVGAGPEGERLREIVERRGLEGQVTLTGAVSQDQIRELFAAADVFCLPSFAEGVPVVLMEAMAMELPVVATRIAGIGELVDDGVSGLLVSPARPDLLVDAVERLRDEPDLRRAMGRAGREIVTEQFDVSRSAVLLRELFAARLPAARRTP